MTTLDVIPHTHWDREWYEPHDIFRARLVRMIDGLLDLLESEPDYRFTLDGQSAAFEDYLELRPEEAERVRAAVRRGQLCLGPFQILLDEFGGDGETIVRNLEHGIRAARTFGGEMRVGYLPDMFGHAAQMPQILTGFRLSDACLWRGVPASVDRHAFMWEALNGDKVRVEYLWDGYGSALKLFEPLDKMPQLVADYVAENASWFQGEDIAGMYGTDHMSPREDLMQIVREYNAAGHEIRMRVSTVGDVVAARDHSPQALDQLPVVVGEMRSHARGNLLPGVFSIRTNLKSAMAKAERDLTTAERLDVLVGGVTRTAFFERGWGLTIESTAHDSVTGCGHDATAREVENRLEVASQTAMGAIDISSASLAASARIGEVAVFNQIGWSRRAIAELTVAGTEVPGNAQVIEHLPTIIGDEQMRTEDLPRILHRIHGQELFGGQIIDWTWEGDELTFRVAPQAPGTFDLSEFTAAMRQRMADAPSDKLWHVLTIVPPSMKVLVGGEIDGLTSEPFSVAGSTIGKPVRGTESVLENSLVRVTVRPDGLVDVEDPVTGTRIEGALRIVDEGDRGDTYNFGPVEQAPVDQPTHVAVRLLESGPLRGRILITRTYDLPTSLDDVDRSKRCVRTQPYVVDTLLELRDNEPFLRVAVSATNTVGDHRIRVHVPTLAQDLPGSASAGQYGVTQRGRTAEGGWGEFPLPTFPATRFAHAGDVAVLLDKLTEYEIVDGVSTDEIALTFVRSVPLMSVNVHPLRDEPAGSQVPTPEAQYLGRDVELRFAIDLTCPDWSASPIMRHSDEFRFEPVSVVGTGDEDSCLSVGFETHGNVVLESLRRVEGGLEARLVNYAPTEQPLRVRAEGQWMRTDLTGEPIAPVDDLWDLDVPANTIITLRRNHGERQHN